MNTIRKKQYLNQKITNNNYNDAVKVAIAVALDDDDGC